jgi:hypothetical protein
LVSTIWAKPVLEELPEEPDELLVLEADWPPAVPPEPEAPEPEAPDPEDPELLELLVLTAPLLPLETLSPGLVVASDTIVPAAGA